MYTPLLAASAAALIIALTPIATPTLIDALDVSDVFLPLRCAMANSGSCAIVSVHRHLTSMHKVRSRPLLAAADLG